MDRVQFVVNGVHYSVGSEISSSTTLLEYLRRHLELRGTKYMCLEGGCGACIVNVTKSPGGESQGVNSCMVPITSCNEWDITTIEKIGNRLQGYHPLQRTLAENNGSQCGYCSPGWVMAMYRSILFERALTISNEEQAVCPSSNNDPTHSVNIGNVRDILSTRLLKKADYSKELAGLYKFYGKNLFRTNSL